MSFQGSIDAVKQIKQPAQPATLELTPLERSWQASSAHRAVQRMEAKSGERLFRGCDFVEPYEEYNTTSRNPSYLDVISQNDHERAQRPQRRLLAVGMVLHLIGAQGSHAAADYGVCFKRAFHGKLRRPEAWLRTAYEYAGVAVSARDIGDNDYKNGNRELAVMAYDCAADNIAMLNRLGRADMIRRFTV